MEFLRAKVNSQDMSYAPESSKQSPNETVGKMIAGPGAVINLELTLACHSTASTQLSCPMASTLDDKNVTNHVEELVYGCKYCDKKFSKKQALGGHQNAHASERVQERNARMFELYSGHVGSSSDGGMSSLPFESSLNRGPENVHAFMTNGSCNHQTIISNGCQNSDLPITQEPHELEAFQGFNYGFHILPNPHLTDSQFIASSPTMEYHTLNLLNSRFVATRSDSEIILDESGGLSTASSLRFILDKNVRAEKNSKNTDLANQQCQTELDLSLKLSQHQYLFSCYLSQH